MNIQNILLLICEQLEETGYPPTIRELALLLSCSIGATHQIVAGLISKGLLEQAGTRRSLTLTEEGLLLIGRI